VGKIILGNKIMRDMGLKIIKEINGIKVNCLKIFQDEGARNLEIIYKIIYAVGHIEKQRKVQ
jgi:hypothetical protein